MQSQGLNDDRADLFGCPINRMLMPEMQKNAYAIYQLGWPRDPEDILPGMFAFRRDIIRADLSDTAKRKTNRKLKRGK
jgi:hypothetical protein